MGYRVCFRAYPTPRPRVYTLGYWLSPLRGYNRNLPGRTYPMRTALLFLLLATPLMAADPKPVRLVAEAEDFTAEKPGWQVVPYRENYYASSFAVTFLSRMACLGAPAQADAVSTQVIDVPADGEFHVLARYEQPFNFAVEFTVEVRQNNATVYKETFGKLADPKIWAFNNHQRVPMERYGWGGTDNIVWQQKKTAMLKKGPATLRLIAAPQPGQRAADRHVDAILLTNDAAGMEAQKKASYLEFDGWLTQAGDLFVRFTNPSDGPGPCVPVIAPDMMGQHSPYYVHVRDWPTSRVLKAGLVTDDVPYQNAGPRLKAAAADVLELRPEKYLKPIDPKNPMSQKVVTYVAEDYLQPGQSTDWVPMGQAVDSLNNSTWKPQAVYKEGVKGFKLKVEFAVPDYKGGYKVIKEKLLTEPESFEIPGCVNPSPALAKALQERHWLPTIRTQKEAVQWLLAEVRKFPKRGSVPKKFLLYNVLGFGGRSFDDPAVKELAKELADNTWLVPDSAKRDLVAHWPDPTPAALQKQEAARKGGVANLRIVSYGDEIHLPPMPVTDAEFAAWLKARGVTVDGEFKIAKDKSSPLYYYSQLCMKEKGGAHYAAGTAYLRERGVYTGANYSPHANYLVSELDYIRPFRLKAMSMPWGEDYVWGIPEFSTQATGYLVSGFRAGAKYDDLPIHMYVMPHSPGTTPSRFRLSFYTAVAHGAKHVDYFCASPMAIAATENYIATDDLGIWKAVHDAGHDAGTFEDYVVDGKVRPAKVGLLLSSVDELMTGVNNFALALHNNERKALYYALRHAQVPVDFLSEDDLIDGRAKDCRVIYVGQQWLHSKALAALQTFAEAGGTVVATAGGGFRDEFNKPNPKAAAFYGVKAQDLTTDPNLVPKYLLKENQPFFAKQDLPVYEPMDTVSWVGQKIPVIAWKQKLTPSDGRVTGTYRDGSPAVIEKPHGKGGVVLFGFLPGQAYLKSGLPLRPVDRSAVDAGYDHFLPTAMDAKLRTALTDAFLGAEFVKPVVCSEPLVESTCIDSPGKLAVPLMNYTARPLAALTVRINGLTGAKKVRSVERGELKAEVRDGATIVTLPLDVADMLLVDR